jgi:hypothetical protein
MFVRIKKSGKYKYLQIVETKRTYGGIRQRVIASLGRLDNYLGNTNLMDIGRSFLDLYEATRSRPGKKSLVNILK